MFVLAAVLTLAIDERLDLAKLIRAADEQCQWVTCGIRTVGYRFVGPPGARLRYDGETYVMPDDGEIELIADRRSTTYLAGGRRLPLDVWPIDQFGFRVVPMSPAPEPDAAKESARLH